MQSWLWQLGVDEGKAKGQAEGECGRSGPFVSFAPTS